MRLEVSINEVEMRQVLLEHVREKLGDVSITLDDIKIETKSKQNYRSEWEEASYRATLVRNGA